MSLKCAYWQIYEVHFRAIATVFNQALSESRTPMVVQVDHVPQMSQSKVPLLCGLIVSQSPSKNYVPHYWQIYEAAYLLLLALIGPAFFYRVKVEHQEQQQVDHFLKVLPLGQLLIAPGATSLNKNAANFKVKSNLKGPSLSAKGK